MLRSCFAIEALSKVRFQLHNMQGEREKWVLNESEINGSNRFGSGNYNINVSGSSVKSLMMMNSESFYQRLAELLDSSGLSLVLNARETAVDLYLLYKEVSQRGGFHQVSRDKGWDEVALALNLEDINLKLVTQLLNLYRTLLIQFENIFSYKNPEKATQWSGDGLGMKRKYQRSFTFTSIDTEDVPTGKVKCEDNSFSIFKGFGSVEQKFSLVMPPEAKLMDKKPDAPRGWRNPYQMFLKIECARLRSVHGSSLDGGKSFREMAIDAWRHLPMKDQEVYIELSRKDKERFWQEMRVYMDTRGNSGCSVVASGDYHVSPQPDPPESSSRLPDQSMVDFAVEIMKTAPSQESVSDVNWHEFYMHSSE